MSRLDDLMIVTSFDQSIDSRDLSILDRINIIMDEAIEKHDAYIALDVCKTLRQAAKISGLGLAKILYLIYQHWDDFDVEDAFEDVVYEYVGLHKYTVQKYIKVWGMHQEKIIPAKFEEEIIQKNIGEQIPIANALKQGYKIDEPTWNKLANASDFHEVAKIVREEVKNKPPSVDALRLYLDGLGAIWAYKGNEKKSIGVLNINDEDDIVQQAIQRIINNCGIMEES